MFTLIDYMYFYILFLHAMSGADPGFCVRGDESRRGVWGPLKVSSGSKAKPWKGPRGAKAFPGSSWVLSIQEAFLSTILEHFVNVMEVF